MNRCRRPLRAKNKTGLSLLSLAALYVLLSFVKGTTVRFWLEEYAFSEGETALLREQIKASEGRAVVSGETLTKFLSTKGYYVPERWDVYWANRQACLKALPHTVHGQRVNCIPGISALTDKRRLIETLVRAYGDGAFQIVPRTFLLPEQYLEWRAWIRAHANADTTEEQMWVLKTNAHRGQGVSVVPQQQAITAALASSTGEDAAAELVQEYKSAQYMVAGRRFYLRVWVVVTSVEPLRAYLYKGGVLPFGTLKDAAPGTATCSAGEKTKLAGEEGIAGVELGYAEGDDLIVNLWRNRGDAVIWSVAQFEKHLLATTGLQQAFEGLWASLQRSIGLALAAGQRSMQVGAAEYPHPPGAAFEVTGVDFLVDSALRPWLLEFNAVPSMARQVLQGEDESGDSAVNAFDEQKEAVVSSLFRLLLVNTGANRQGSSKDAESGEAHGNFHESQEEVEAARHLEFLPLCAFMEALKLSAEHQPQASQKAPDGREQGLFAAIMHGLSRVLTFLPARVARGLLTSLGHDSLLSLMAQVPGLDNIFLSMKLLAEGHQWQPGRIRAIRMLYVSPVDRAFCEWLHGTAT